MFQTGIETIKPPARYMKKLKRTSTCTINFIDMLLESFRLIYNTILQVGPRNPYFQQYLIYVPDNDIYEARNFIESLENIYNGYIRPYFVKILESDKIIKIQNIPPPLVFFTDTLTIMGYGELVAHFINMCNHSMYINYAEVFYNDYITLEYKKTCSGLYAQYLDVYRKNYKYLLK